MDKQKIGIVLLVIGILIFWYATTQISNLPSAFFTPYALQDKLINGPRNMYRVLQLIGFLSSSIGGLIVFKEKSISKSS